MHNKKKLLIIMKKSFVQVVLSKKLWTRESTFMLHLFCIHSGTIEDSVMCIKLSYKELSIAAEN